MSQKIIKGDNCFLELFKPEDEELTSLIHNLFNETETKSFLNPDYTANNTKPKIRKWIKERAEHPTQRWYVIKTMDGKYIGYVCYKWSKSYNEACEISTSIAKEYRGLKLGYESSIILVDYIKGLKDFRYIVAYSHLNNERSAGNLRKMGFKKFNRLYDKITLEFYQTTDNKEEREYNLFVIDKTKLN